MNFSTTYGTIRFPPWAPRSSRTGSPYSHGRTLKPIDYKMPVASAQKSCLLFPADGKRASVGARPARSLARLECSCSARRPVQAAK